MTTIARRCGDCQLCCRLLAVRSIGKLTGQKCNFQKHGKGCLVYSSRRMPQECQIWNCRWLVNDDTADQSRPDRSHLVIDITPDFVTARDNETGVETNVEVIQVWCDPKYPDAHRDPTFRAYLARRGEEGVAAIIRYNSQDAIVIMPPALMVDGTFHEVRDGQMGSQHSFAEILHALSTHITEENVNGESRGARSVQD